MMLNSLSEPSNANVNISFSFFLHIQRMQALSLLINLVNDSEESRRILMEIDAPIDHGKKDQYKKKAIEAIIDQFYKCVEMAK